MATYTSNLIPIMTSNTAPSGVASASSIYSASNDAWVAFDGNNTSTKWATSVATGWVQYKFNSPQRIGQYAIIGESSVPNAVQVPETWTFLGSNDGVNWTTLDNRSSEIGWVAFEKRTYSFANSNNYLYYRLNISACNGGTITSMLGLEMMGIVPVDKYLIQNEENIYTVEPNFYKIGQAPVSKAMFDNYGTGILLNMTKTFNESAILMNKIGALGTGNEFNCILTSDVLSVISKT